MKTMRLFLISPKNVYATKRLIEESDQLGIELTTWEVGTLINKNYDVDPAHFDALYIRQAYIDFRQQASPEHLQSIIELAQRFKSAGKVVVDQSIAEGDLGSGKYEALIRLQEQGITIPSTSLLKEISNISRGKATLWQEGQYPFIAKWNYGFGAQHTYLIKSADDWHRVAEKYPVNEIIVQEFIPAEFEYKVITVGYQPLPVILKLKTNHNKFLPNLMSYEVLSTNEAPEVAQLAVQAAKILQRQLAKVDILQAGDKLYVLEVNRWPGLQYFEKISQFNVAREFLRYIQSRL